MGGPARSADGYFSAPGEGVILSPSVSSPAVPIKRRRLLVLSSPGPSQKSVLVLAGEGPYFKNSTYYIGTMFDQQATRALAPDYPEHPLSSLRLVDLCHEEGGSLRPLLRRKRGAVPQLTSFTLEAILLAAARPFEL